MHHVVTRAADAKAESSPLPSALGREIDLELMLEESRARLSGNIGGTDGPLARLLQFEPISAFPTTNALAEFLD